MEFPKRGELWVVNLDPTIGAEIKKRRQAVIISNDINNQYSRTVTILPVTDKGKKIYPFEVRLQPRGTDLTKESKIKCQQIRTVDKQRIVARLGALDHDQVMQVERALRVHLEI